MDMNKFYLVNYNRMFTENTISLIETYLYGLEELQSIAHDVLINDYRLFDNTIDSDLLVKVLDKIEIEDLWYFASFSRHFKISQLAFQKLMQVLDEYDILHRRSLIKLIK